MFHGLYGSRCLHSLQFISCLFGICCRLPSLQYGDLTSFSMLSGFSKTKRLVDVESHDVVALAKKALSASKQAALLADELHLFGPKVDEFRTEVDEFQTPRSVSF